MFKPRIQIALAFGLLLSLLIACATAASGQKTGEWIVLAPVGEGFSVSLPAKPEEQTDRVAMEGNSYKTRLYTSVDGNRTIYMVVMQEFPKIESLTPAAKLEQFVDGFKEGLTKAVSPAGSKVELLPNRNLDLKGKAGREYTLTYGENHGFVRVFDGGLQMYVLLVMGADPSVGRFFDSFEIKAAPPPMPVTETKSS